MLYMFILIVAVYFFTQLEVLNSIDLRLVDLTVCCCFICSSTFSRESSSAPPAAGSIPCPKAFPICCSKTMRSRA